MAAIKSVDTKPEMILRRLLFRYGFRYRLHYRRLPGCPDIVLPKYKAAVFVHGCFWHQHRGCKYSRKPSTHIEYWDPKLKGNVERDKQNTEVLRKLGWNVIIVWQCKVEREIDSVMMTILSKLDDKKKMAVKTSDKKLSSGIVMMGKGNRLIY